MPKETAKATDMRVCRMHDLVVRDASGHSRAFTYGEVVELTPALVEALGAYVDGFVPLPAAPIGQSQAKTAAEE